MFVSVAAFRLLLRLFVLFIALVLLSFCRTLLVGNGVLLLLLVVVVVGVGVVMEMFVVVEDALAGTAAEAVGASVALAPLVVVLPLVPTVAETVELDIVVDAKIHTRCLENILMSNVVCKDGNVLTVQSAVCS